jgi:hypothetical protein
MKARLGPIERIEKESPVVNSMRALMLPATTFRPRMTFTLMAPAGCG